jgi:hypothetical protein
MSKNRAFLRHHLENARWPEGRNAVPLPLILDGLPSHADRTMSTNFRHGYANKALRDGLSLSCFRRWR